MRKIRLFAFLAIIALALSVAPAGAFHNDDLPLIAGQSGLPNGWRAFTVTTNGSEYSIDITTPQTNGKPVQAAAFFYKNDNSFAGGIAFTAFAGKDGVLVRINPPAGDPVEIDTQTNPPGGMFGLGLTFNDPRFPPPFIGTWKILVWWAGDGAAWEWTFRGLAGTNIDATLNGNSAYLVDSADFASLAQAEAHNGGIGVRASVLADYPLSVGDTLIGFYQMGLASHGTLSVTSPRGEQQCGLAPVAVPLVTGGICLFADMIGPNRNGPGSYVFHTTSVGAGFAGAFDDVWFGGADARLP